MEYTASVRTIVEFAYKSGNIESGFAAREAAFEGSKAHRAIQKQRQKEESFYLAEVPVSISLLREDVTLLVSGRIDGVLMRDECYVIEEIKTTNRDLLFIEKEDYPVHLAQAKCYAYIYSCMQQLEQIGIQLTYYNRATKEMKSFIDFYSYDQIDQFWAEVTSKYLRWMLMTAAWNKTRNESIEDLEFPFDSYRRGQREFAVAAYRSIDHGKNLFARAPTGIGKTIAAIFPSVKAVGQGKLARIFYLTAKTSTRRVAEEGFERLRAKGLRFRTVTLSAKEKMCRLEKISCRPEDCKYARGYYDRVDVAIEAMLEQENFTKEEILRTADKHEVCPFEFALDLSLFCDGIICDYNYAFDPRVYLKRFFQDVREEYGFLIDEAHNLVDRAREMYSGELLKSEFLALKKLLGKEQKALKKSLNDINNQFIAWRKELDGLGQASLVEKEPRKVILELLEEFAHQSDLLLEKNQQLSWREQLLTLYFNAMHFMRISELFDDHYDAYMEKEDHELRYKLFCIDPSRLLREGMQRSRSTLLFSATLTPANYYIDLLGGQEEDYKLSIPSPFDHDKLLVMLGDNIPTKFRTREYSYERIAEYLGTVVDQKQGNYMVFFPSYQYMQEVYSLFVLQKPQVVAIAQRGDMSEEERGEYLALFDQVHPSSLMGFAVMGGAFGEGIDLTGDRLLGVIIVGVGLPQLCLERDLIRTYFNQLGENGFEYAYVYPGMNKVLQAVGRVIRTQNDRGIALLLDERFRTSTYRMLMPGEWSPKSSIRNSAELCQSLATFWKEGNS